MAVDLELHSIELKEAFSINEEKLGLVTKLSNYLIDLENTEQNLMLQLKSIQDQIRKVKTQELPDALLSTGIDLSDEKTFKFPVKEGYLELKKNIYPSIKKENQSEAYDWLLENGHDIIKNEIKCNLTRSEYEKANLILEYLLDQGVKASLKETIHPQTFRAWAKQMMEEGLNIPEIINIHIVNEASIKRNRKEK